MPDELLRRRGKSSSSSSPPKPGTPEKKDNKKEKKKEKKEDEVAPSSLPGDRFGPMPRVSKTDRVWFRSVLILGLMVVVYFTSGRKEEVFADEKNLKGKSMAAKCSPEISKTSCAVVKCGRLVTDALLSGEEVYGLIDLARRGFVSHPGVSVMDLDGRVVKFGDVVRPLDGVFRRPDAIVFQAVKSKLQRMVSTHFGIDYWKLNLAGPVFMSMLKPGGKDVSRIVTHQDVLSYTYSTVVFLNDYDKDFKGGRLSFVDNDNTNRTVLPMQGRALAFTSGPENKLYVEKLEKGISYMLTVGFTCDKGIEDPTF